MANGINNSPIKFWTPLRLVSSLIVLGLFAMFGVSSCNSTDTTPPATNTANAPAVPGKTASYTPLPAEVRDAQFRLANGSQVRLSDYSGKVVLLNLWATWCGPCRTEIPELVKIHKEFQSRGVAVLGLSTENPEASAEQVKDFVRLYNMDYQVGWSPPEVSLALMQGRESIPQSFVITRDGKIYRRFIGFSPLSTPPQLRKALEEALN
jgi:thiol-disulfide isomerase/thioredoxin